MCAPNPEESFPGIGTNGRDANELCPAVGRVPAVRDEQRAADGVRCLTPTRGEAVLADRDRARAPLDARRQSPARSAR
jgi:hypothetical protein